MRARITAILVLALTLAACTDPAVPDGWSRVFADTFDLGGAGNQQMLDVIEFGGGLVAVGMAFDGDDRDAAVWLSADGITWTRAAHADLDEPEGQTMWSVATGGPGLVAVGFGGPDDDQDAAIWTSHDGVSWTRVPHDETTFGASVAFAVATHGDVIVATGFAADAGATNAAVWVSSDGVSWSRVPHDDATLGGSGEQVMYGVASTTNGLVAVGSDGDRAAVWASSDGATWARVMDPTLAGRGTLFMSAVTTGGPGLVAAGVGWEHDRPSAAVWTSTDGRTWNRVTHDEATFGGGGWPSMQALAANESGVVVVGMDLSDDPYGDAAVWTSPDGISWSRVDPDRLAEDGFQSMNGVLIWSDGLVAVGAAGVPPLGQEMDAAVWVALRK